MDDTEGITLKKKLSNRYDTEICMPSANTGGECDFASPAVLSNTHVLHLSDVNECSWKKMDFPGMNYKGNIIL